MTLATSLLSGCVPESNVDVAPPGESIAETDASALYVSVLEVSPMEVVQPIQHFTGIIRPTRTSDLSFGRSARIASVDVAEGAVVAENTTLATLDQSAIEAKASGLRESLEASQAELSELNTPEENDTPEESQQRLEQLRRQLNALETEAQNNNRNQDVPRRIDALERQLRLMDTSNRQQRIQELNRKISQTEGELLQVEAELEGGLLTAPFAGTVARIYRHKGALVSPAVPVLQLASENKVVKVTVTNAIASTLNVEDEVTLQMEDDSFAGRVRTIDAQLDPNTRTRSVTIGLEADSIDRELLAGEVVTVHIESGEPVSGFRLPVTSLNRGMTGIWSVYVVEQRQEPHRLTERLVEIEYTSGSDVYVTGELEAEDLVVRDGVHRLVPGQAVHIASNGDVSPERGRDADDGQPIDASEIDANKIDASEEESE